MPAVTEMIFAMGAGSRLVARQQLRPAFRPKSTRLPRVGGAARSRHRADPGDAARPGDSSTATQTELRRSLDRASIPYFIYEHRALPDIMATIRAIGARIGSPHGPTRWPRRWSRRSPACARAVAGRRRPRTLLVFERDRSSLRNIYASGGYGFLARPARDRRRRQRLQRPQAAVGPGEHRDDPGATAGGDHRAALRPERHKPRARPRPAPVGFARLGSRGEEQAHPCVDRRSVCGSWAPDCRSSPGVGKDTPSWSALVMANLVIWSSGHLVMLVISGTTRLFIRAVTEGISRRLRRVRWLHRTEPGLRERRRSHRG